MPTALFVSPHLDDVAFSCGATLAALAAASWRCVLATVFTRSVADARGFALRCQTDKGLAPEIDYMALRREEDAAFARRIGPIETRWLDLPEAPHRGYESPAALFAAPLASDAIVPRVAERLRGLAHELAPELVFLPQALGEHVDHVLLVRAAVGLAPPEAIVWYRDAPYAIRHPRAEPPCRAALDASGEPPARLVEWAVDVDAHLATKLEACAAYGSQLGFQFGGERAMRDALAAFAFDEGRAAGLGRPAERFLAVHDAALGARRTSGPGAMRVGRAASAG